MTHAAVVVGVNVTGDLAPLEAAVFGAEEIKTWLEGNDYEVSLLTDKSAPVTLNDIHREIKTFVDRGTVTKLAVYFAGHGYLKGNTELWLLTGAPGNSTEAVNVAASTDAARASGIPHVIFISDACRSLPLTYVAQKVEGGSIFPNRDPDDISREVDHFYATRPGSPALEMKIEDALKASGIFSAMLRKAHRDPPAPARRTHGGRQTVTSRWLKQILPERVDRLAQDRSIRLTQRPDLRLECGDDGFLAYAEMTQQPPSPARSKRAGWSDARDIVFAKRHELKRTVTPKRAPAAKSAAKRGRRPSATPARGSSGSGTELPRSPLYGIRAFLVDGGRLQGRALEGILSSLAAVNDAQDPLGPAGDLQGSISVKGEPLEDWACTAACSIDAVDGRLAVTFPAGGKACSVALRFASGAGTVIAALKGYDCSILATREGLQDLSYRRRSEFSSDPEYQRLLRETEKLRALASVASAHGLLEFDARSAEEFADRIRELKLYDPTLGMIATLAYASAGLRGQACSVLDYSRDDLRVDLFDTWLLAGAPHSDLPRAPLCPMLTQSWSLLGSRNVQVPPKLAGAARYPGFWTSFHPDDMPAILAAVREGEE